MCDVGKRLLSNTLWIWKRCTPRIPCSDLKPSTGTFEVPVTNCRKFAFISLSKSYMISQNHLIACESLV